MPSNSESRARDFSTGIDLVAAVSPAVFAGDKLTALVGVTAVGVKHVIERFLLGRQKKLDDMVQASLEQVRDRVDTVVQPDEFIALYIRARETAARSEREEKLEFIRNFMINAVLPPTSHEPDKERYLRLLDDFSAPELSLFVDFCKKAVAANHQTMFGFLAQPQKAFLLVQAYARDFVGLPATGPVTPQFTKAMMDITFALRRFEGATLLDGTRSGGGDPYAFSTNAFTAEFLKFVVEPSLEPPPRQDETPTACISSTNRVNYPDRFRAALVVSGAGGETDGDQAARSIARPDEYTNPGTPLSQLVFLTFFLGLVSGPQTVSLNASPDIRTIAILVDEQKVATFQPPFTGTIDFGGRLAPRQLVAVGYDDRGNEVARATQVLNVPHPPAEAAIVLSDGARRAEIRWMEKAHETPSEVLLTVDGRSIPVDQTYAAALPSLDAAKPHVIEAQIRFPSGAVARHDVTIAGGSYAGSVDSELTPVIVNGDAQPEKLSRCFDARVSADEKSHAFVVVVKDPNGTPARLVFEREFRLPQWQERAVQNMDPLDADTSTAILWPVMEERRREGNPTMAVYGSSQEFSHVGLLWTLTSSNRRIPAKAERRYADAVAVAGMLAATRGTRRAVVLFLQHGPADTSSRDAASVRAYLQSIGVPLHVWAVAPTRDQRQAWGDVSDVSRPWELAGATKKLRADLGSQTVVWLATDPWHALRAAANGCH